MRVLITNDDGIGRRGLRALVEALDGAGHDVRVLAPRSERSGAGASLGTLVWDAVVPLHRSEVDGFGHIVAHALDAPPALGVRAACLGALGWRPEVVVAGVNPGYNTGRMVIHSGTVGAGLTAASCGIPGVAVSTEVGTETAYATAATLAAWTAELLADDGLPPAVVNLNVPPRALHELGGIGSATLSDVSVVDVAFHAVEHGLEARRSQHEPPFAAGTDAALLSEGYAAVSTIVTPWSTARPCGALSERLHNRWCRTTR